MPQNICASCHIRPVRKGSHNFILCQECRDRSERIIRGEVPVPASQFRGYKNRVNA